jgi:predicted PurR-regulated permease PerM
MVQINTEFSVKNHRRQLLLGGLLLVLSLLCVAMTIMFVFVNNSANRRVEDIRQQYRAISDRREARVAELTSQLVALQKKLDGLPDRTANKTADKVKQVVGEDSPSEPTR